MTDNNASRNRGNSNNGQVRQTRPSPQSGSYNARRNTDGNHAQTSQSRPQRKYPQRGTPRSAVIIYLVMIILILAICIITVVVLLQKQDNTGTGSNNSASTGSIASGSAGLSQNSNPTGDNTSVGTPSGSTVVQPLEAMSILGVNMVYVGEEFTFSCRADGYTVNANNVSWECTGDSGRITADGCFTALSSGEVTLTATDSENNIFGKLLVHVVASPEEVDFIPMVNDTPIINKTYPLPSDYAPGGLTAETAAAFDELVAGAAADGINIYLLSGYRSYTRQQSVYLNWCNIYGQVEADRISARPGFSEHQSGMAIDVNSLEESFGDTAEGQWLAEHCWEYGFIIRYPQGKEHLTGYSYEPWHIRYLGRELAEAVTKSGLCLEEYMGIDSYYR